jgi:hypothetical protein
MRKSGLLWGVLVLLAGVLFLMDNLGFLQISAWSLIFPGALILIGLWFLLAPLVFRQVIETRNLDIPLEGMTEAKLKIRHGAGELRITSGSESLNLLEGTFIGGVEERVNRTGSLAEVKLRMPEMEWWGFPTSFPHDGLRWDIALNRGIAYSLDLKTGASKSYLDLHDMILTDIHLETGASNTEVFMPEQAGYTKAEFHFGSATLDLHVPQNVAAKIKIKGALMSTEGIDKNRFPVSGEEYCSSDYASAANKIDISIEAGVGKVVIK